MRAGTAPEFDALRASVQVANVRQSLVTAEANYRRALANLVQVLGIEPRTRVELVPLELPPEPDAIAAATARRLVGPAIPAAGPPDPRIPPAGTGTG